MDSFAISALHNEVLSRLCRSHDPCIDCHGIASISKTERRESVADAPSLSLVDNRRGKTVAILLVSSEVNPGLVAQSVTLARDSRVAIGPELGGVIPVPIADGSIHGLSFALWPYYRGFSFYRSIGYLQKKMLAWQLFEWLNAVSRQTARKVTRDNLRDFLHRPLDRMAGDPAFPEHVQQCAKHQIERLSSGSWQPISIAQHGDLWLGNILLPPRGFRQCLTRRFIIIDWAGAKIQGYPFYDLVHFGMLHRVEPKKLNREIDRHCGALGCERGDVFGYLLGALGNLGGNLGFFPTERFVAMASSLIAYSTDVLH